MSWSVSVSCPTCGHDADAGGYTYNVAPMFAAAGLGCAFSALDGMDAGAVASKLASVRAAMEADPPHFSEMNPENGWGDYAGALDFLSGVILACHRCPEGTVHVQ